jgi:predicted amidohydrolase
LENLTVTIIQTHLHWQNREANFEHFEKLIDTIEGKTNLIVLPEMFTSGFTMDAKAVADKSDGEVLAWMKSKAKKKGAVIVGSTVIEENRAYYNRLLWVKPDGTFEYYNKRHLFRMAKENEHYAEGKSRLISKLDDWRICPLVCYDLRFPSFSRNVNWTKEFERNHQYEVLIYVANWPKRRSHAWKSLLVARAIENQCYVIGVNRIGVDGNEIPYSGDSMIINPLGEIVSKTIPNQESVESVELNLKDLKDYRIAFPAIHDADEFELKGL